MFHYLGIGFTLPVVEFKDEMGSCAVRRLSKVLVLAAMAYHFFTCVCCRSVQEAGKEAEAALDQMLTEFNDSRKKPPETRSRAEAVEKVMWSRAKMHFST